MTRIQREKLSAQRIVSIQNPTAVQNVLIAELRRRKDLP